MKKLSLIIAAVFIFGVTNLVKAQDDGTDQHNISVNVPSFAILDIEGGTSIDLSPDLSELEPGAEINFATVENKDLWLNYTSVAEANGQSGNYKTRKVTVEVDEVIPGVDINLIVLADAGNGNGNVGNSSYLTENNNLTLSETPEDIITGIGTSYTGDGTGSGHGLVYTVDANNFVSILGGSKTVTVTYTITDENGGGSGDD